MRFGEHVDSHGLTLNQFEVRQTAMESLVVAVAEQTLDTDLNDGNYHMD